MRGTIDNSPTEELDVRSLVPAQRHETIFQRIDELGFGASFVLINDHDSKPLYYQLEAEYPKRFSWDASRLAGVPRLPRAPPGLTRRALRVGRARTRNNVMIDATLSRWTMSHFALALVSLVTAQGLMAAGYGFPNVPIDAPQTPDWSALRRRRPVVKSERETPRIVGGRDRFAILVEAPYVDGAEQALSGTAHAEWNKRRRSGLSALTTFLSLSGAHPGKPALQHRTQSSCRGIA